MQLLTSKLLLASQKNTLKRQRGAKRHKSIAKAFCDSLIQTALSRLNETKEKNDRKLLHYGIMSKFIQELLDHGVHVTRNALNYLLITYVKPII
jgi:phosphate uptake regulator